MTEPTAEPAPSPPTWSAATLLAVGLVAFVWVSDVQGVMFHRAEFQLGDWMRPVLVYVLGAVFVVWEWDRVARTFLSRRFAVAGGTVLAAVVLASLPDAPARPTGIPTLRAGTRETLPEIVHTLAAPRSTAWIEPQRVARPDSLAGRMGIRARESAQGLVVDLPPGWVQVPASDMRPVDLRVTGQPLVECYVSSLPGAAGGTLANINRWRTDQLALDPIDDAAFAALPHVRLLGVDAVQVEYEGTFRGVGKEPIPDAKLLGVIASLPQVTLFLKMTGPKAAVDAERKGFEQVRDTLRLGPAADPHGSNPHGATPSGAGAPRDDGAVQPPPASGIRWDVPAGWRQAAARAMRVVTLVPDAAPGVECYVTELAGDGGGVAMNVNRWRKDQFGADALGTDAIAALPTVPMFGRTGTLVEVTGTFTGMGAGPQPDHTLLGVVCRLEQKLVTVKMVGPTAKVEAERERFLQFCRSLRGE